MPPPESGSPDPLILVSFAVFNRRVMHLAEARVTGRAIARAGSSFVDFEGIRSLFFFFFFFFFFFGKATRAGDEKQRKQ